MANVKTGKGSTKNHQNRKTSAQHLAEKVASGQVNLRPTPKKGEALYCIAIFENGKPPIENGRFQVAKLLFEVVEHGLVTVTDENGENPREVVSRDVVGHLQHIWGEPLPEGYVEVRKKGKFQAYTRTDDLNMAIRRLDWFRARTNAKYHGEEFKTPFPGQEHQVRQMKDPTEQVRAIARAFHVNMTEEEMLEIVQNSRSEEEASRKVAARRAKDKAQQAENQPQVDWSKYDEMESEVEETEETVS